MTRTSYRRLTAAVLAAAVLAGACTGDDGGGGSDGTGASSLSAELTETGLEVADGDRTVLGASSSDGRDAAVAWRDAELTVEVKGGGDVYLGHELLSSPSADDQPWAAGEGASIETEAVSDHTMRVTVRPPEDEALTQLSVSFACQPDEQFSGLGAQSWATRHRGETVPIWVVEQGLGKITPETPDPPPSLLGEPYDSYAPIPVVYSTAGYGVSYVGTEYAQFELCTEEHPDTWRLETWSDELTFDVFVGDSALQLIERYTEVAGRPTDLPPDWFFAPMNDAVRGQDNVARVADLLRDEDIPSSVIWTEDWIGIGSQRTGFRLSHDWDVSETEYPDLRALTDGLHDAGFRFLGYFSPFIPTDETTAGGEDVDQNGNPVTLQPHNQEKWLEAREGEFYFTDADGGPLLMLTPPFNQPGGAGLDLTDAEAVEWFTGYLERAEELGLDGSMTDFGEWVPVDAQFDDGRTGAEVHNEYPLLWQETHRRFWDEARPDGDFLFYVRSGYTGTQVHAPAFWGGDQNTTFDRLDGLGSVITLGVNLGMSGIPFYGHDIAGYSAFAIEGVENTPTTKELFLRWASIGAYTPMMRTHHGSRYGENWSFEGGPNPRIPEEPRRDEETIDTWRRLATEHIRLFPYQQAYAVESVERGLPIMRHPALLYPDDPVFAGELPDEDVWADFDAVSLPNGETFQYFLGDELLVAPIIDEGVNRRPVYLPEGDWIDIHSGERHSGPGTVMATAEPGEIPVYAPAGALIPRLPDGVDTLAETDDPDVVDHTDVADELVVDVFLGADGEFTLADGTTFTLDSDEAPDARSDEAETADVAAGDERTIELDGGATLTISDAPVDRTYTVGTG